jgi:hypothetical protein
MTERFAGFGTVVSNRELTLMLGKMMFRTPPAVAARMVPDVVLPNVRDYLLGSHAAAGALGDFVLRPGRAGGGA